ncbi:MAG: sn-glycerol-3-phosphate ABC transporter ATP-binding protein UgpC [Rhizobiaceae bacterium]|jgi:multiple sugar transport system ATP-binding protein|nr:sn-glycerol-3-phosphate ABC transporter ATP-binding protein UgpC [Rhizobiaceae bacterium]
MAKVFIRDVRKAYEELEVLHGVSIDIADGEFVVLVGPSGCGKSTLLRMIAGLEGITSGTIEIGGRVVNHLAPAERDIAMVFQNYALYPHKTVRQNMAFALKLRKIDPAEIENRVKKAAGILGLEPYLDRYPRQLSGGQRQRVAMGRAIVRDPQVFLFDEPLSNLDAKLRVNMRTEIKELHQRLKVTTVYVTHDQVEAMTMADKIVVMQGGHIEQMGPPLDLFDKPANVFVAGFIGSPAMNLLNGEVQGGAVKVGDLALPLPTGATIEAGRDVTYGVRPEHFDLDASGFEAKVSVVEPTGSETLVFARHGETEVTALFRERHTIRPGDMIRLRPRADVVHVFDAASGKRI